MTMAERENEGDQTEHQPKPSKLEQVKQAAAEVINDIKPIFSNATELKQTAQLRALMTMIRSKDLGRNDFVFYSDRIIRLLVEEGLNELPLIEMEVDTPTGVTHNGVAFQGHICGVSIMRAGESMESALRATCKAVRIGKILIQRDEETAKAHIYYHKLPKDIADRWVFLLDPMLATGGSAIAAIEVLKSHNVPEDRIIFLNLVAAPEGIKAFSEAHPKVKIITAKIDDGLNDRAYIMPGLGDFGCRYFGTD